MSREPQEVELYNGRVDAARVRQLAATLFDAGRGARVLRVWARGHDRAESAPRCGSWASRQSGSMASISRSRRRNRPRPARRRSPPARRPPAVTPAAGEAEVTVLMDGRRRTFTMKMNDETVLDAAPRARPRAAVLLPRRGVLDLPHEGGARRSEMDAELRARGLGGRAGLCAGLPVTRQNAAARARLRREIIAAAAVPQWPE